MGTLSVWCSRSFVLKLNSEDPAGTLVCS